MEIMLMNWSGKIKEFLDAAANAGAFAVADHEQMMNSMKEDLEMIKSALWTGEKVILVFASGSHFEIYPLFEKGEPDIRNITKDFNKRYQYNSLKNQIAEKENHLKEALKDNPEALADLEKLIEMKRLSPLFTIDLYKDNMLYNSYQRIAYRSIEAYIYGVLAGFGMVIDNPYTGQPV